MLAALTAHDIVVGGLLGAAFAILIFAITSGGRRR